MELTLAVSGLRSKVDRASGLRDAAVQRLAHTLKEVKRLENESELQSLVADLFRTLIDQEITQGVKAVEKLQSEGLQAVFPDQDMSVRADIDIQRGKVSVELVTVQRHPGGMVVEGLSNDAFGGSVSTVQSVLLRLTVILRRGMRPLVVMDETLPAFDGNYVSNMGDFLAALCSRLGFDILLVTHNPALVEAAHRAYRIVKNSDEANFEVMR